MTLFKDLKTLRVSSFDLIMYEKISARGNKIWGQRTGPEYKSKSTLSIQVDNILLTFKQNHCQGFSKHSPWLSQMINFETICFAAVIIFDVFSAQKLISNIFEKKRLI